MPDQEETAARTAAPEMSGVKSARRAIELIEAFAANDAWMSLADLQETTGMPRSSLHGLLRTLVEVGWLETNPNVTRYRLGVRALICGTAYLDRDHAVPYATQALEQVRAESGFTTHFARRHGTDVVYLETRESQHSTRLVSRVGRTLPAHATALGKALLAELTTEEIEALLPEELLGADPEHRDQPGRARASVRRDPGAGVRARGRGGHPRSPLCRRRHPVPHPGDRRAELLHPGGPGQRRRRQTGR